MKFRLVYSGPVRAINRDPRPEMPDLMALHKHTIRADFHKQLKRLWEVDKFLSKVTVDFSTWPPMSTGAPIDTVGMLGPDQSGKIPLAQALANQHPGLNSFRFAPLVSDRLSLLCALDILFLRWDGPEGRGGQGQIVSAGDLDNRMKTIVDALRPPKVPNEYVGRNQELIVPLADQDPLYVLMEDDNQVSHLSVEADRLLELPDEANGDASWAKVIITVELRTYYATMFNASLV